MQHLLGQWLGAFKYGSLILLAAAIVFAALEQNFFFKRMKKPWRETFLDLEYFCVGLLYPPTINFGLAAFFAFFGMRRSAPPQTITPLRFSAELLALLFVIDVWTYIRHRLFHSETLWLFHSIHHSSENVNWTSGQRVHPVESLMDGAGQALAFFFASFVVTERYVLLVAGIVIGLWNFFVHANLRWTFGPLRYVVVSPMQHRWHHCDSKDVMNKNFAVMFSCIDVMLGTFYMPRVSKPGRTGLMGDEQKTHPRTFFGQMIYPFKR